MNSLANAAELFSLERLRRFALMLAATLVLLVSETACSPADTAATGMGVPEATTANIERAQDNLSSQAVNENDLSRQNPATTGKSVE
ncbi:MAG: hypothetical protein AAFV85_07620 [Cyanobacteria bacterium J06634_6]